MTPFPLHSWRLSPKNAIALQNRLRSRVVDCPIRPWPEFVAGADISYAPRTNRLFAAVVVLRLPEAHGSQNVHELHEEANVTNTKSDCRSSGNPPSSCHSCTRRSQLETVEEAWVTRRAQFPYVPGLLTFREAPALLAAFKRLRTRWDAAMLDGQGRAHPRGMGLAAHIGLWLDAPTVGCAKSRLIGEVFQEPGPAPGDYSALMLDGRTVGASLRTRRGVKPVYVSAGHKSNLADSIRLVLACCAGYRIPEPTRRAHALVTRLRAAQA
jgi:deoxyribonuclease V